MKDMLQQLCSLPAVSGREDAVREFILNQISTLADVTVKTDNMGNIIALKKGKNPAKVKLMVDAHMDEVGFIITSITDGGLLRFSTVGGIDVSVLLCRRVKIGDITGVIGMKPIHLTESEERKKMPKADNLYIDIGAADKETAERVVSASDVAVFDTEFSDFGDGLVKSKAIDDRAGCAVLIKLLQSEADFDFTATFSVQEEVGLRGAKTVAYAVDPEAAIVVEATTAADIAGTPEDKTVCNLGGGVAVSFMDNSTVYDRGYYLDAFETAKQKDIPCQPKSAVAGGNNSGAISVSKEGIRTLSLSLPCRYIHSGASVASLADLESLYLLTSEMITRIASGEAK